MEPSLLKNLFSLPVEVVKLPEPEEIQPDQRHYEYHKCDRKGSVGPGQKLHRQQQDGYLPEKSEW